MSSLRIPHIEKKNGHPVLMMEERPYILLAGEVHNSDASSPAYMEHIWETAEQLGMNTLLLPVSWELTEPEEGRFDFSIPRALILQGRQRSMRVVFLWFGTWKNAECMYAPPWVKRDLARFPRAQIVKGRNKAERQISPALPEKVPYTTLSYLGEETKTADAKAFAAFLGFLKEFDEEAQTVIAVQVENETGLLGAAREVSREADALYFSPVPEDFAAYLREHTGTMTEEIRRAVLSGNERGTWPEVFGEAAEELFSAYHISRYVHAVAGAGKAVYPLPMTVNCWLDRGGKPGDYPAGGPVSRVREVWEYCAPEIDVYCPDIYVPEFREVCDEYVRRRGALFIPECATHSYAAPRLLYTVGHYHAMCYSPFGFDDIGHPFSMQQGALFGMDVTDPALKTPQDFAEYAACGHLLKNMMPMLAEAYGTSRLQAVSAETDPGSLHPEDDPLCADAAVMDFGSFRVSARFHGLWDPRSDGALLCLQESDTVCWLVGNACQITLSSLDPEAPNLDLLSAEEGCFEEGRWVPGRRLNGDETASMTMEKPSVWKLTFFTYA